MDKDEDARKRGSTQVSDRSSPAGSAARGLTPQPIPEPPDFELSIGIDAPIDSTVLHPSELPFTVRGSTTAVLCTAEKVEIRLGEGAAWQTVTPGQPGNWSTWSFTATPSPANGPVRLTARATGFYMFGAKKVTIRSDANILVLIGAGIPVPAFWGLDAAFQPQWQKLNDARSLPSVTVIDGSWPGTAQGNATFRGQAVMQLDALRGVVLGYVSTRGGGPSLLPIATIMASVKAWFDQFGTHIDGIYFDELAIPDVANSVQDAKDVVAAFRAVYPNGPNTRLMILAGQCLDEFVVVVGPSIDWALMWEDKLDPAYRVNFAARDTSGVKPIPSWWKNPQYRDKIAHVVHTCSEADRQYAIGLSNERNAGHIFVMDARGLNANGDAVLYDHLPPYWDAEVSEVHSFYDFGFDPLHFMRAASRYGVGQGKLHAWPNGEAAWYSTGHVRGTFLLEPGPHATRRDVLRSDLPGAPELYDIPRVWAAAHAYAQAQGFETALPTFEPVQTASGPVCRMILFVKNLPWLTAKTVPVAATYQQPTFAEPAAVVRNVNRWAGANGFTASFPTFVPDDPSEPRGRKTVYNCYVLGSGAPVSWRDVPTTEYLRQL
jgi:hypothetical protein